MRIVPEAEYKANLPMLLEHGDQLMYDEIRDGLSPYGVTSRSIPAHDLNSAVKKMDEGTAFMNGFWAKGLASFLPPVAPILLKKSALLYALSTKDASRSKLLIPEDRDFRSEILAILAMGGNAFMECSSAIEKLGFSFDFERFDRARDASLYLGMQLWLETDPARFRSYFLSNPDKYLMVAYFQLASLEMLNYNAATPIADEILEKYESRLLSTSIGPN